MIQNNLKLSDDSPYHLTFQNLYITPLLFKVIEWTVHRLFYSLRKFVCCVGNAELNKVASYTTDQEVFYQNLSLFWWFFCCCGVTSSRVFCSCSTIERDNLRDLHSLEKQKVCIIKVRRDVNAANLFVRKKSVHIQSVRKHSTYIRLPLTMLPWKRNRLLLGRPRMVVEYRPTMKSVSLVKPVSRKSKFRDWAPTMCSVIFLKLPLMQFYLGRRPPYITEI
jgi:hypothetical protein